MTERDRCACRKQLILAAPEAGGKSGGPDFTPLEFAQRFTGTFSEDGDTISGAWEKCFSGGDWLHDFDLIYRRAA